MAKEKSKKSESEKPTWMTVTPKKDSDLTMEQRQYLEALIVEHCDKKATIEKEANLPVNEQLPWWDKRRCWHAAYSACARHILKEL